MSVADLLKLPAEEKPRIIEPLWADLTADEGSFVSNAWEEALRKTEAGHAAGRIETLDCEDAQEELRTFFE